jgi:hypothetical protein
LTHLSSHNTWLLSASEHHRSICMMDWKTHIFPPICFFITVKAALRAGPKHDCVRPRELGKHLRQTTQKSVHKYATSASSPTDYPARNKELLQVRHNKHLWIRKVRSEVIVKCTELSKVINPILVRPRPGKSSKLSLLAALLEHTTPNRSGTHVQYEKVGRLQEASCTGWRKLDDALD